MKARRAHRVLWADSVRYRPLRRTWTRYLPGEIGQIGLGWTSESLRCSVSGQWLVYYRLGVPVVEARCPVIEYVFTLARILRFFHARNFHRRKKNLSRAAGRSRDKTKKKKRKDNFIPSVCSFSGELCPTKHLWLYHSFDIFHSLFVPGSSLYFTASNV